MGANTALLDVCDLAEGIIDGIEASNSVNEVLRMYEKCMIPRGRRKVLESRATAESESNFDISGGRLDKQSAMKS
jgi:hypothetical protein